MLKKIRETAERKRNSERICLRNLVIIKDFLWWILIDKKDTTVKKEAPYFSQIGQDPWVLEQTHFKKTDILLK
ncbi:MAG: hypothetical protein EXS52_02055 [Candidatus Staskawiczbacteria bacterium]|nr:hypothetical protein [Candidatus Staskawiczbacteria bacterium]